MPCYLPELKRLLADAPEVGVGAVVGFPSGAVSTAIKVAETREQIAQGATEVDMVLNVGIGVGLAAAIGLPGLALYAVGRALGLTVQVQASALGTAWWTIPVLILAALQNALLEEVVAVAFLMERLRELRWPPVAIIAASALLRGSYHLYQGIGPFVGNAVMGVVFAEYYRRRRRVMPLVVAHTVLDIVAFVGYALVPAVWRKALGLN